MIPIILIILIQLNIIVSLPKYTYDLLFIIFLIDFKVGVLQNHRSPTVRRPPTTNHRSTDRYSTNPSTTDHQPTNQIRIDPQTNDFQPTNFFSINLLTTNPLTTDPLTH